MRVSRTAIAKRGKRRNRHITISRAGAEAEVLMLVQSDDRGIGTAVFLLETSVIVGRGATGI